MPQGSRTKQLKVSSGMIEVEDFKRSGAQWKSVSKTLVNGTFSVKESTRPMVRCILERDYGNPRRGK